MRNRGKWLLALAVVMTAAPAWAQSLGDVKKLAPPEAHLVVYGTHNSERDFQREYAAEIWQTFQDERIVERVVEMVTSRAPEEDLAKVEAVLDELKEAAAPMNCDALADAKEVLYFQVMEIPTSYHLVAMNLGSEAAEGFLQGATQLMELAEEKSGGEVSVKQSKIGDADVVELAIPYPDDMPFRPFEPVFAKAGDLFIFSTKVDLLTDALDRLQGSGASKFDDQRLAAALKTLPEPEDALTFFDGEQLFERLGGIGEFIRMMSQGDPEAARVAGIIDSVMNEVDFIDYTVTVEYTEGNQNRSATMGKFADDASGKLLFQALATGEPFDDWQSWTPADADGYSLNTGLNVHVLYEGIMDFVRTEIPESKEGLDQWAAIQEQVGVNLDEDILQSFSGESVTISLPGKARDGSDTSFSVTAMKCSNPEKINELLHRAFDALNQIPQVQAQGLQLVPVEGLEGFEQLTAPTLAMFGATPVIGFHDGWMMLASNKEAVERVLAVRSGEAESIEGKESVEQFNLDVDGTVYAVKYSDIAKGIHQFADGIESVGAMLPMMIGMAGANASPEDLKPVQEVLGLLPSVAKVIRKFDYMEKSLTVTKEGPQPLTFVTDSSMILREPVTR